MRERDKTAFLGTSKRACWRVVTPSITHADRMNNALPIQTHGGLSWWSLYKFYNAIKFVVPAQFLVPAIQSNGSSFWDSVEFNTAGGGQEGKGEES